MTSERLVSGLRRTLSVCTLVLFALACTLGSRVPQVRAQEEQEAGEYRVLIDQALNEFARRNWPEARVLFRRAHELNPNARTLRGMGLVSYEMRDYVSAVVELRAALDETRQVLTDTQRGECEQLLSRSRSFVGAYALEVEPTQAAVSLDGAAPVRDTSGHVLVPFGDHTLRVTAPSHGDQSLKLHVQGGEQSTLHVVLQKVVLTSEFQSPAAPRPNPFVARADDARAPVRHGKLRYSWVALGATAAFGAVAVGSWVAGQGKLDDLDQQCRERALSAAPCARGNVDTGSVKTLERTTNAMLGLAGAALVTTAVLATFEWPRERRSLAIDLAPQRVALRGSF